MRRAATKPQYSRLTGAILYQIKYIAGLTGRPTIYDLSYDYDDDVYFNDTYCYKMVPSDQVPDNVQYKNWMYVEFEENKFRVFPVESDGAGNWRLYVGGFPPLTASEIEEQEFTKVSKSSKSQKIIKLIDSKIHDSCDKPSYASIAACSLPQDQLSTSEPSSDSSDNYLVALVKIINEKYDTILNDEKELTKKLDLIDAAKKKEQDLLKELKKITDYIATEPIIINSLQLIQESKDKLKTALEVFQNDGILKLPEQSKAPRTNSEYSFTSGVSWGDMATE
jgi:hypothetical protein